MKIGKKVKTSPSLMGIIIAFAVLFIASSIIFADKQFFSLGSINNLLRKACTDGGILALGMTFVMLAGYIDLSVGSVLAFAGVITALVCPISPILAVVAGIAAGVACGFLNGFIVTKLSIPAFVATLATMLGLRGVVYLITEQKSISIESDVFTQIANTSVGPISILVIIFAVLIALCIYITRKTRFGIALYAVGGNEEAARMMGLKVDKIKISAYVLCGLLAGIGGVLLTSRLSAAQAVAGENWETTAIASAALGGIKLTGGEGHFLGTLFGVLIVAIINTIFNYAGNINTWWQNIIMGLLLMVAVAVQSDVFHLKKKKAMKLEAVK